jgi:hypothetical protein
MARPVKEGMDYFPHDTDATGDEKVETLMMLYGAKGYAFYFILLERIYRQSNFELDISDAETQQILSRKIAITHQEFETILKSAIKHNCFDKKMYEEFGILTSNGIKKRTSAVIDKRQKMRKTYIDRVSASETIQKPSRNAAESTQSKVKESKEKKSIVNNSIVDFTSNIKLNETIKSFIEMRKSIKSPMTDRAIKLMIGELDKLAGDNDNLKIEILNQSIMYNWKGVFALEQQKLFAQQPRKLTIAEKAKELEEDYERRHGFKTNIPNKGYISIL